MNEDGIIGSRTLDAFAAFGASLDAWGEQIAAYTKSFDALGTAAYELILDENGDDSKDDTCPASLDPDMTDPQFYWDWMLKDAKKN